MKKLLTTTALVGSVAFAGAAFAGGSAGAENVGGLNVTVGGFSQFEAGFSGQDLDATGSDEAQELKFKNDNEVHVNVAAQSDNGLKYGATIELEADRNGDDNASTADRTFIYAETGAGRFETGGTDAPTLSMKVDAADVARGTGGINGQFVDYVANDGGQYISKANLVIDNGDMTTVGQENVDQTANKVVYYTPRVSGFQGGLSYTPDSGNTGQNFTNDNDAGDYEDVWAGGLNYEGQFDQVGVRAALTGETGDSQSAATEDLAAWQIGTELSYMGFSLAGSYGDQGDSGQAAGSSLDADFWTLGGAYETGPFGVSLTYLDSSVETGATTENTFNNLVVGADYQLAPGLLPFVEVSFFEYDNDTAANNNDGTVVLVGTNLTF